jgi:phage shock protein C
MKRRGRELYRLPNEGKVAGVCAGIAEYFNLETWLVRIIMITGVLFSGAIFVIGYIAAWFILDARPGTEKSSKRQRQSRRSRSAKEEWQESWEQEDIDEQVRSRFKERPIEVKEKVWQAGEPPRQAFHDITGQFDDLEKRLQNLETYVTSPEFTVSREIDRL